MKIMTFDHWFDPQDHPGVWDDETTRPQMVVRTAEPLEMHSLGLSLDGRVARLSTRDGQSDQIFWNARDVYQLTEQLWRRQHDSD